MNISLAKGKYIVGVSGGVDSTVLLDVLCSQFGQPNYEFVVAHFDHGIRSDSTQDAIFVKDLAQKYGCDYEQGNTQLGKDASEEQARTARYEFLRSVLKRYRAKAIITAHHQDDLLETMLLHLQRGTGRGGLSPMLKTKDVVRPLLGVPKSDILEYANGHKLKWREDSTNLSDIYARNRIRKVLQTKLTPDIRRKLLAIYNGAAVFNPKIDKLVCEVYKTIINKDNELVRSRLVVLPVGVGLECVKLWLQSQGLTPGNKQVILRCYIAAKTLRIGKKIDLMQRYTLYSGKNTLKII